MPYADPERQKQFFREYYRKNKAASQAYGKARRADHVDHCHATGKVRGVLCAHCNQALGQLGDTRERLQKAVDYLSSSEAESAL